MADLFSKFTLTQTESGLDFDVELEPGKQVYCFIGENGCGKTSMLEALAQVAMYTHEVWVGAEPAKPPSFRGLHLHSEVSDRLDRRALRVPVARINGQEIRDSGWDITEPAEIRGLKPPTLFRVPVVFVPATHRSVIAGLVPTAFTLAGNVSEVFAQALSRHWDAWERSTTNAMDVSLWIASRLIVDRTFLTGLNDRTGEVYALLRLLRAFDEEHFGALIDESGSNRTTSAVTWDDGSLKLMGTPIGRLASGYTALLRIFQEIVASIAAWEAVRNSTNILGSDAIILIDEIDAHLHAKWQRRLVPFLKTSFPNATFLITTHSPLVVANTDPGEAYELVKTGSKVTAKKLGSPRDWYFTDVLSDAFHVDLPAPGTEGSDESPPLVEVLLDFHGRVRAFTVSQAPADRDSAMELYSVVLSRLADDDPRRKTAEELRELLR